jgi:hypothetical protein
VGTHFWRLFALAALAVVVYAGWQVQATWEEARRWPPKLDITTRNDHDEFYSLKLASATTPATVVLRDRSTVVGYYAAANGSVLFLFTGTSDSVEELVAVPWDNVAYFQVHVNSLSAPK